MQMNDDERSRFRKSGFVVLDHDRRYSFGSAYCATYTRDLPVLVTSDSILHALHRSYGSILKDLESQIFTAALEKALSRAHGALGEIAREASPSFPIASLRDADLYLAVARNLLAGEGAPIGRRADPPGSRSDTPKPADSLPVPPKVVEDGPVLAILDRVSHLKPDPLDRPGTLLFGGRRFVDWSQFGARGHYAGRLEPYFRTMMWLGRADTGIYLSPPTAGSGVEGGTLRELRTAALLVEALRRGGVLELLGQMTDLLDFLVGRSDNLTAPTLAALMRQPGQTPDEVLSQPSAAMALRRQVWQTGWADQAIRSQGLLSDPESPTQVQPPGLFQLFGQRTGVDSAILARVVYDSILFEGEKVKRFLPSGLDLMAALGNDEALRVLSEQPDPLPYAANLAAARDLVAVQQDAFWESDLYHRWLRALRVLDERPAAALFPQAMRTRAWARKQLQAQLAGWAELRHDTLLYGKQAYTAGIVCEYPAGYVEPYPEFYAQVAELAEVASRRIWAFDSQQLPVDAREMAQSVLWRQKEFFERMAVTVRRLESLAVKELRAEPFTQEEERFLKKTIDARGGGSGPPRYDGWYPDLYYEVSQVRKWDPTLVDVHTDPTHERVLAVGTGDANFAVAVVDNEDDRRVYVGPVSSYYEIVAPARQTDAAWQRRLSNGEPPPRPSWASSFVGAKEERTLP